ncbi:MarR family winged helix-turn-helix transcriptional regulator [Micromonospora sp. NPDC049523]|uniref:MarR family winged helix-turn-helix transcriptional regulator n=1 Tax=Micromonospora sp. NPDC049523 TaxID=3155921 RepID=UPI0034414D34
MRKVEQLRFLILAAQREGNRLLAQNLRPLGVTPSQAEVLRLLADRQPLTLGGLGELLVCESGTNPSRLVDRLVAAGLVDRVEAPHDRRTVELTLTAAGRDVANRVADVEERLYETLEAAGTGLNLDEVITYLHALTTNQPSGQAVQRRTQPPPPPTPRR